MKMDLIKMLLNGAKTIAGSKPAKDVLKYLSTIILSHVAHKYGINQYKYDINDMKNMVYHHNINNNHCIDKNEVDTMMDIMHINRFMSELSSNDEIVGDPMTKLINKLTHITNDEYLLYVYNNMMENGIIQQFDHDTLETSSIADSYEINSGRIFIPDRNVITTTNEGCILADAKNDYLEKRMNLGVNADSATVELIINEFKDYIEFDKVLQYFNN